MIADALPPIVAAEELFNHHPHVELFDLEEAVVADAVDKRRREFASVRHCARRALASLGYPQVPLVPGERGAPLWPAGIVGSMTHCDGYCGAAVARSSDVRTIGIDAEPHAPVPCGVLKRIARPEELPRLDALRAADRSVCWERLLFSCKESVYKAWYPLAARWLGFDEASITIEPVAKTFSARLLVPGPLVGGRPLQTLDGRWLVQDGLVLSAIALLVR